MPPPLPSFPLGIRLLETSNPTIVVEMFLDLSCPFSKRMYETITSGGVLDLVQSDMNLSSKVEFVFHNVPQPWHPQSCSMHEAMFAALCATNGKSVQMQKYLSVAFQHAKEFEDIHSKNKSRIDVHKMCCDIIAKPSLGEEIANEMLTKYLDFGHLTEDEGNAGLGQVTKLLKFAVKHHRTRGVHVSPTVFVNMIEAPDISSSWTAEQWITKLKSIIVEGN